MSISAVAMPIKVGKTRPESRPAAHPVTSQLAVTTHYTDVYAYASTHAPIRAVRDSPLSGVSNANKMRKLSAATRPATFSSSLF